MTEVVAEDSSATGADVCGTRAGEWPTGGAGRGLDAVAAMARELAALASTGDVDAARVLAEAIDGLLGDVARASSPAMMQARRAADRG